MDNLKIIDIIIMHVVIIVVLLLNNIYELKCLYIINNEI